MASPGEVSSREGTGSAPRGLALGEPVAGWVVSLVLPAVVAGAVLAATGHLGGDDRDELPLWLIAALQVPVWVGLVGAAVLASRRRGTGDVAADLGLQVRRRDAVVGVAWGLVVQLVVVPLLYVPILRLLDDADVSAPARALTERAQGPGVIVLVALVVVGAPIVEELFYRGLLLRALERRLAPRWALVVSSAVFALAHLQWLQFPALFVFGLAAGRLAQRHGRLGPSIWAHAAFNAVTVAVLVAGR